MAIARIVAVRSVIALAIPICDFRCAAAREIDSKSHTGALLHSTQTLSNHRWYGKKHFDTETTGAAFGDARNAWLLRHSQSLGYAI